VVSVQSTPTGLERQLFNVTHDAPLNYGLACVFTAILLGWTSPVPFGRPD
jgi:hypothetical protein